MTHVVKILAVLAVVPLLLGAAAVPDERQRVAFEFADPRIAESSALVALTEGRFATTNDSGDAGRVFTVGPAGKTVGVSEWSSDPVDVEALAQCESGTVWVGDIGDNGADRDSVQIAEVPVGPGPRDSSPTTYDLVYPDGAHDAESLACNPETGRLFVATKQWAGSRLYAVPTPLRADGPNRLRPLAPVLPMATDAAFFPDGRHLIVRGYLSATVYEWPGMGRVGALTLPRQPQGEGIAVGADGGVHVSSEGLHSRVLRVSVPGDIRRQVAPPEPAQDASRSPSDSSPSPDSAAGQEPGTTVETADRALWPWALGGLVGLAVIVVLIRSLRPR